MTAGKWSFFISRHSQSPDVVPSLSPVINDRKDRIPAARFLTGLAEPGGGWTPQLPLSVSCCVGISPSNQATPAHA